MTGIDWMIVAFSGLLAIWGYIQGFIVGMLSLLGFALGAFVGTRVGPLLLPAGAHSPDAPLFGLVGALLAGGVLATGFEGLGLRARAAVRLPGLRAVDGVAGAALTACVGLGVAWIIGAVALQASGSSQLRRDIQRSAILRGLNGFLPPSGPILNALARLDPLPSVRAPRAPVGPPSGGTPFSAGVRTARPSVVRVIGSACGLGVEGSGWVAAPGTVVTNAHVVAGESDTVVQPLGRGPSLPAQVIAFDSHDDVAVLHVAGLREPALRLSANVRSGASAAVLGYPLDGGYDAEPARAGDTERVSTQDAYGNGPVVRDILSLRGRVRPGNSGGPLISTTGQVLGTVFAAVTGGGPRGGFAVPNAIVRAQLARARGITQSVDNGPCAS